MCLLWKYSIRKSDDWQGWFVAVEIHERKFMLCLWWDQHDIIYSKFLKRSQTVNKDLDSQKWQCVRENLLRKCPSLIHGRMLCFFVISKITFNKNNTEKYCCSIPFIIFTRSWFASVCSLENALINKKVFSRISDENVCVKWFELEANGIVAI